MSKFKVPTNFDCVKIAIAHIQTRYVLAALLQLRPLYIQAHTIWPISKLRIQENSTKTISVSQMELGKHDRSQMSMR